MILLIATIAVALAAALVHIGSLSVHLTFLSVTVKALIVFVVVATSATVALCVRRCGRKGRIPAAQI